MKKLMLLVSLALVLGLVMGCPQSNGGSGNGGSGNGGGGTVYVKPEDETISNYGITMKMVGVAGGTFIMGSAVGEKDASDSEKPEHPVTLNSFYLGSTEVTEKLWERVMGGWPGHDPFQKEALNSSDSHPARYISWYDAITFCNRLSYILGLTPVYSVTGVNFETINVDQIPDEPHEDWEAVTYNIEADGFRLPTEAEWEYAAGGGKSMPTTYAGTNNVDSLASYAVYKDSVVDKDRYLSPVKSKSPVSREYDLYDMSGNVFEFCWDRYGAYGEGAQHNPTGATSGDNRIVRGGMWIDEADRVRVAARSQMSGDFRRPDSGFRVARNAE